VRLRPRLTVRARLTLLYTGLFAACGAILVTISYFLVAQLGTSEQGQSPSSSDLATIISRCRSHQTSALVNKPAIAQCVSTLEQQLGAQHQRALTLSHLLLFSLFTLAAVIALAAVLGWVFSGRSLRPVHQITAAARAASEHNLSARVALDGPRDELTELAQTFDEMLGRLQAAFEGQRQFIANASHELRTPLTVMRTSLDVVLSNQHSSISDLRSMGKDIGVAVDHAEHLIGALLILGRGDRALTVREEVNLATVTEDVLDAAAIGDCQIHATLEDAVISGDPVLVEHLIANLVDNAIRYNTVAGDIWITTRTADTCRLTVDNTGPVMNADDADRIFEPFQRLSERTSHEGSGLGLAIVASIAAVHGGSATARPREEGGLSVTVTLPQGGRAPRGAAHH
jgi:signal transduction histidine kinase